MGAMGILRDTASGRPGQAQLVGGGCRGEELGSGPTTMYRQYFCQFNMFLPVLFDLLLIFEVGVDAVKIAKRPC
jgi:hypothetical protein